MSILGDLPTLEVKPTAEPEKILKGIVPLELLTFSTIHQKQESLTEKVVHKLVDLDFPTYHSESSNCFFYMKMNEPFPPGVGRLHQKNTSSPLIPWNVDFVIRVVSERTPL